MTLRHITVDTPIGTFTLSASDHGLRRVSFPSGDTETVNNVDAVGVDAGGVPSTEGANTAGHDEPRHDERSAAIAGGASSTEGADAIVGLVAQQFCEYFNGTRREFDIPLDLQGTDFQLEVWHSLAKVPYGETSGYGVHAASLGRPTAARAVGAAAARNPVPIVLPCHRIVSADGSLTGFAGGLDMKQRLLAHEQANRGVSALEAPTMTLVEA